MNNFSYVRADTHEAARAAAGTGDNVRYLAGGTDLIPLLKDRIYSPASIVDISGWRDSSSISSTDTDLLIGALTALSDLASDETVRRDYAALAEACNLAASPQLRNMGSLAGNLLQQTRCWYFRGHHNCWMKGGQFCYARDGENENHAIFMTHQSESKCVSAHPSDPGAALLALDATILILTDTGPGELPITEFFALPSDARRTYTNLPEGALITGIRLPKAGPGRKSSYTKAMARASWAFALAGIALSVDVKDAKIGQVRVAVTGVAPIPFRVTEVERQISGSAPGDLDFDALAETLTRDAAPLTHNGYKVQLLGALFRQALADLLM